MWNKDALIIDERFNSGGQIPDRFIELLNRPVHNYWARREQHDWQTPFVTNTGPKVMLVNGWAGSGGGAFPYYFRKAGLGPLVSTRTWGTHWLQRQPATRGRRICVSANVWLLEHGWQLGSRGPRRATGLRSAKQTA